MGYACFEGRDTLFERVVGDSDFWEENFTSDGVREDFGYLYEKKKNEQLEEATYFILIRAQGEVKDGKANLYRKTTCYHARIFEYKEMRAKAKNVETFLFQRYFF